MKLTAIIDGASRGNPGPAAIGILVRDDQGNEVLKIAQPIGTTTNNVAEYTALITCLKRIKEYDVSELTVKTDSQLMARQVLGAYKVRNEKLRPLFQEVQSLLRSLPFSVKLIHVPRTETKEADKLANQALNLAGF